MKIAIFGNSSLAILGALSIVACGSSDSGGSNGSGGSSAGGAGVHCGGSVICTSGQSCCVPVSGEAACETTCTSGKAFACDGPEDCGGKPCCGSFVQGFSCATGDACDTGLSQRCHVTADCTGGKTCVPANITPTGATGAVPLDSCSQI